MAKAKRTRHAGSHAAPASDSLDERWGALLRSLVEGSEDAIVTKTLTGIVTSWNSGAERVFGYTAEEMIGQPITKLFPPDRLEEEKHFLSRLARGERIAHYETVRVRADGSPIDISVTLSPLRDSAGEIIGAAKIARDITERRRVEARLAQLLEAEQSARADAETANQAKDRFLAMLSHELRNPLSAILNAVALLELPSLPAASAAGARQVINRQARHLGRMVDDLLDIARVTSGKIVLELTPVNVAVVARRAIATLLAASPKAPGLVTMVDDVWVLGDETRLEQVWTNLLDNAVKHTPTTGQITVEVRQEAGDAVFAVADTGAGIGPDLLPHVFELFVQGERGIDRTQGGLGLGLRLVQQLMELHKGTITAASEGVGRGARFTARMPALPSPFATRTDDPERETREPQRTRQPRRVLLIEDERDSREMLGLLLSAVGHEIRDAADGATGLDVAKNWSPDVIVVDLGLPGLDGYEVARRARALPGGRPILVALTGYGFAEDRRRTREAGFDHHVVKPADLRVLMGIIDAAGQGPRPW
jgi:PAS domain S-box-containing protein